MRAARRHRLQDGRQLCVGEFGDSEGTPVMGFHGGLSCRLEGALCEEACRERGVRLLIPDRPGIGGSDPCPGRELLDWADDVAALADGLGIERFAAYGWSAGGPYALACALRIPERLTRVASVAGVAPLDVPGAVAGLGLRGDRLLFPLCRLAPALASGLLTTLRWRSRAATRRALIQALRSTGDPDAEPLAALAPEAITAPFFQALEPGGRGTAQDYALLSRDFGFPLESIAMEVQLWHGEADGLVPLDHARRLAERIPHARLHTLPGRGHFLPWLATREILDALLA